MINLTNSLCFYLLGYTFLSPTKNIQSFQLRNFLNFCVRKFIIRIGECLVYSVIKYVFLKQSAIYMQEYYIYTLQ